jgi:transposase
MLPTSPSTVPCSECGDARRRVWEVSRLALDLDIDGPTTLRVRVGVYHCADCQRYFRTQPPFLRPNAVYTNRVVRAAVESVLSDGMPLCQVKKRLARDLWVSPSEVAIRGWCKAVTSALDL